MTNRKGSDERRVGGPHEALPSLLRVLPCAESASVQRCFQTMQSIVDVVWLPIASPSILGSLIEGTRPDLIVIAAEDFRPAKWPDADLLRDKFLNTPTILLTRDANGLMRRRAARFGICSVLSLDVTTPQLLTAFAAAGEGLAVTMPNPTTGADNPTAGLRSDLGESVDDGSSEHLTGREIEVLRLLANGRSNKQIAALLRISEHTAKFHVSSVLGKLGAGSRTEAVSLGILRGLVAI